MKLRNTLVDNSASCADIIAYIWDLNDLDKKILLRLCEREATINELCRELKRTRVRIYQRLNYLLEKKFVNRKKRSLRRGYEYVYSAVPESIIRKETKQLLKKTFKRLLKIIDQKLE